MNEKLASDFIIETRNLTKEFQGFIAVKSVNLKVKRHSIHALIGPNGAGKTTMFNLLTKFLSPSSGSIAYNGSDITRLAPADVARIGLVRSFQISAIYPHLSLRDNVRIALQRRLGISFHFWRAKSSLSVLDQRTEELLDSVGLLPFIDSNAVSLPYGRKRALEIATTLALDPETMLLDEPTSGLGIEDIDRVVGLIRSISANRTIVMVEHNLSVVADLSDTITVLARGEVLAEGPYHDVAKDARVVEAYIGSADV